ncbi:ATP-dependent DNA helicase PIF1-like [Alosa sapidissima]|uniref:ATP-dependent DNA helicase PIF1-like n=1 Tax=Alosa sapidissima TaxID=34773 RepID=UPI001C090BD6|nr:ATP-dependent DNA helicase PIF1-like [Alosa sapidissima]
MGSLQILIIDEVSMVDHRLLAYIHGRLRQIKQTGDYSLFAKVSLICVGDFFQLKPVKGTPLFAENKGANLWDNNFEVAELTKVVRQENAAFAEMLNRLRVRKKNEPLTNCDVLTLRQRETETWLNVDTEEEPQLPGYVFKHNPRGNCYDDSEPAFAALKQQQRVITGHL